MRERFKILKMASLILEWRQVGKSKSKCYALSHICRAGIRLRTVAVNVDEVDFEICSECLRPRFLKLVRIYSATWFEVTTYHFFPSSQIRQ